MGGDTLDDATADLITSFESKFAPKSDRGINYNWMWLNADLEKEFRETLEAQEKKQADREGRDEEPLTYPTMIFVKPPKKKREERLLSYIRMPSGAKVTSDTVADMVEKVSGGATYTRADLPKFARTQLSGARISGQYYPSVKTRSVVPGRKFTLTFSPELYIRVVFFSLRQPSLGGNSL